MARRGKRAMPSKVVVEQIPRFFFSFFFWFFLMFFSFEVVAHTRRTPLIPEKPIINLYLGIILPCSNFGVAVFVKVFFQQPSQPPNQLQPTKTTTNQTKQPTNQPNELGVCTEKHIGRFLGPVRSRAGPDLGEAPRPSCEAAECFPVSRCKGRMGLWNSLRPKPSLKTDLVDPTYPDWR